MPTATLQPANRGAIQAQLADGAWMVACLCAAWCDVCSDFRSDFDALAERLPGVVVLWIDIEDEADVVGDFDVENFPTLLIQHGERVTFYGVIEPDGRIAERLVAAQMRLPASAPEAAAAQHTAQHTAQDQAAQRLQQWNLARRLLPTPPPDRG